MDKKLDQLITLQEYIDDIMLDYHRQYKEAELLGFDKRTKPYADMQTTLDRARIALHVAEILGISYGINTTDGWVSWDIKMGSRTVNDYRRELASQTK